jgi:hypothetical protein
VSESFIVGERRPCSTKAISGVEENRGRLSARQIHDWHYVGISGVSWTISGQHIPIRFVDENARPSVCIDIRRERRHLSNACFLI